MSNIESIIATVKSDFKKYENLLDEDDMYKDLVQGIKSFGTNATQDFEDVLFIENSKVELPDNFYKIREIRFCEPLGYESNKKIEVSRLVSTNYYSFIQEVDTFWNECDGCCKDKTYKAYTKDIYLKDGLNVKCNFLRGDNVILTNGTIKKYCDTGYNCTTSHTDRKEASIMNGRVLQTNFEKGYVYIRYKGFPIDNEGFVDYIDTPNGNFELFLENHLKTGIAERLMIEGIEGMSNLLGYYSGKRKLYKTQTSTELKYNSLNLKNTANKIVVNQANDYARKSLMARYTMYK